jgi:Condensation domain
MSDLETRLRQLSPDQRARLLDRLRRRGAAHEAPPAIEAPAPDAHVMSPAQELSLRLHESAPDGPLNGPLLVRLRGAMDAGRLREALAVVVGRHPALRACVLRHGGRAWQRVPDRVAVEMPVVDLRSLPEAEIDGAARSLIRELIAGPFDLARTEPPWRSSLFRLGDEDHVWALVFSPVVCDGSSRGEIVRQMLDVYAALGLGQQPPPPPESADYLLVARRHQEWLAGERARELEAYWRSRLEGASLAPLRGDRPRPAVKTFRGTRVTHAVPAPLVRELGELGEREGMTLYQCLLGSLYALLHADGAGTDLVVTTHTSTRSHSATRDLAGMDRVVGVFTNPVLMRATWSGDPTLSELLLLARSVALEAGSRQETPVIDALRDTGWVGPEGLPALVGQVTLGVGKMPKMELAMPGGLTASYETVPGVKSDGDLGLFVTFAGGEVQAQVEYDTDQYDEATANRFWRRFVHVVEEMAGSPRRRLSALAAEIGG